MIVSGFIASPKALGTKAQFHPLLHHTTVSNSLVMPFCFPKFLVMYLMIFMCELFQSALQIKHLGVIMNKSGYIPAILNLKDQCFKTSKNIFYLMFLT